MMKTKSRLPKKQKLTFASFLYKVAGFFLLLTAISNIVFNVIAIMMPRYNYGYGFASTSYLFMYLHEVLDNISLRMGLIIIISFFFSGVITFIATEINRAKLHYLIVAFIAYTVDFLFLLIPFPYVLSLAELNFAFISHISILALLFVIIIFQFIFSHLENVKIAKKGQETSS